MFHCGKERGQRSKRKDILGELAVRLGHDREPRMLGGNLEKIEGAKTLQPQRRSSPRAGAWQK